MAENVEEHIVEDKPAEPARPIERHDTTIIRERRGGSALWVILGVLVVLVAMGIFVFRSEAGKNAAIGNAADQVGQAAGEVGSAAAQVGDAAEQADEKLGQ